MMTPEQLLSALKQGLQLGCGALCFGDEPQRLQDTVDALCQRAYEQGFETKQLLMIESAQDWELLFAEYNMPSLFAERRILLVYFSNKPAAAQSEQLLSILQQPNPDIFLILRTTTLDKSAQESKWIKAWDQQALVVQSKSLPYESLLNWLKQQASQQGMSYDLDALDALAHWSEGNLMAAKQTLLRWQLLSVSHINIGLLEQDQQDWARYDVFALLDCLAQQKLVEGQRILRRLYEEGEDAVLVLWALSKEVRLWRQLQGAIGQSWQQLCQQHRLWGARAQGLQRLMRILSPEKLVHWQAQCLNIDKMIKGQLSGDVWLSLSWLLADMSSAGKTLKG
jgi:DNA polymerase-3 subunit delta